MKATIQLSYRRDGFALRTDLTLESGVTGLTGPSGSGKSTFLHLLAGLLSPDQGRITLGGRVLFDSTEGVSLSIQERQIGLVFQDSRLFPHLSAAKNLTFSVIHGHRQNPKITFEEVVDLLELAPLLSQSTRSLSGGEARRIALGRALLSDPKLLLMDEPFSALDETLRRQTIFFVNRACKRLDIPGIVVSHQESDLSLLASVLLRLSGGEIRKVGRRKGSYCFRERGDTRYEEDCNPVRSVYTPVCA